MMTKSLRIAAVVLLAGLFVGGCIQQPNMPAAGAAGWRGRNPNTDQTVRFVVISDRTGGAVPGVWEQAVEEINLLQPDLVLSIGDHIQGYVDDPEKLKQQWLEVEAIVSRLDAPYFYCAGNHDLESGNPAETSVARDIYLKRHSVQGKPYYSFDYKKAHFVVLDSTWIQKDELFAVDQLQWLREDIKRSQNADHIFVFYHHPLWNNQQYWSELASILPREKTTIFNGHMHSGNYRMIDGIPSYVLPATGGKNNPDSPAGQHMFAYVALNGKKPKVSFIPVGAIKPEQYLQGMGYLQQLMRQTDFLVELPANGGTVTIGYDNPSSGSMSVEASLTAPGGTVEPANGSVTVAGGQSGTIVFTIGSLDRNAANPTLAERFTLANGTTFSRELAVPVYHDARLGQLSSINVDGKDDEWKSVPPIEMNARGMVYQNGDAWKGSADSSSSIRVAVCDNKLVMFISAKDDQIVLDDSAHPWEQDGIEICWDVRGEGASARNMAAGTGQLCLALGAQDGASGKVAWRPRGQFQEMPASVQIFTRRTEGGYTAEIAIPFDELGLSGGTLADGFVRLCIAQNDLDGGEDTLLKRMSITGTGEYWRTTVGYSRFQAR